MEENKKWYEYDDSDKVMLFYSKFSIDNFWNWWSSGKDKVMEVRVRDFQLIKETAKKLKLPYSASGIYVSNSTQLKLVIKEVRDKATVWFGINPRKKNYNKWGTKSYGGMDVNVQSVDFIFVDIDRIKKVGWADTNALKNCDILADQILSRLEQQGWNKSYLKICSANGIQLIIKLDHPIVMPEVVYDSKTKEYLDNDEFEYNKEVIRKSIGSQILRFGRKFKEELNVEIDKSGFNIGRVGALPVTKNIKYEGFRWRGILELKDGVNEGLSDYSVSKWEDVKTYKEKSVFGKVKTDLGKHLIKKGKLMEHKLVQFILTPDLPEGECNNKLWFQLKCLLRDSKFDLSSKEYKAFHRQLEKNWKTSVASNLPDKKFSFDTNVVNSFFINNLIPPIYDLLPHRTKRVDVGYAKFQWDSILLLDDEFILDEDTTIQQDLLKYSNMLVEKEYLNNLEIIGKFLRGCIIKYGEEKTKYYYEHLFERYFSYK